MSTNLEKLQGFLLEKNILITDPAAIEMARAHLQLEESELQEFFGHGPLSEFLADETVTEILVNGFDEIWIEKGANLEKTNQKFSSELSLKRYVRRILSAQGRKADHLSPFADGLLEGKYRLHISLPPVARQGICLSIRKPHSLVWSLSRLLDSGTFSQSVHEYMRAAVIHKKNIFISGGTGSGKTSLLSALLGEAPANERIIALEDVAEIRAAHPHFLSLEARPANQEGEGEISVRKLLKECLRMRPDRIVVGECRGSEALDLLLTLNSGHQGSMGTIHANSPRAALSRLETLGLLGAENLKQESIRQLIAGCVDVVIQLERKDGKRRVSAVAELKGVDGGNFLLKEIKL